MAAGQTMKEHRMNKQRRRTDTTERESTAIQQKGGCATGRVLIPTSTETEVKLGEDTAYCTVHTENETEELLLPVLGGHKADNRQPGLRNDFFV